MSDLPDPGRNTTVPDGQDPSDPARNATGNAAKVVGGSPPLGTTGAGGSSPLGTKIAELLLDAVFITVVIGVGLFLWKKKNTGLGEPVAPVLPPENEDNRQ
jgi:hypothetical protein